MKDIEYTEKERKMFPEIHEALSRLEAAYDSGANDEAEKIVAEIESMIMIRAEEIKVKHSLMASLRDIIIAKP